MDSQFQGFFMSQWKKYFANAELPIRFDYTDHPSERDKADSITTNGCMIGPDLDRVRQGHSMVFGADTNGCRGAKSWAGFILNRGDDFNYFMSTGIPGKMRGERHKKTPQLVQAEMNISGTFQAPTKYMVLKRWDKMGPDEEPVAVSFFATADVISGLHSMANYDYPDRDGVTAPRGPGCGAIFLFPHFEEGKEYPRCVMGMFDVSGRPASLADRLLFTAPYGRFQEMVANMDGSFLEQDPWLGPIRSRME